MNILFLFATASPISRFSLPLFHSLFFALPISRLLSAYLVSGQPWPLTPHMKVIPTTTMDCRSTSTIKRQRGETIATYLDKTHQRQR